MTLVLLSYDLVVLARISKAFQIRHSDKPRTIVHVGESTSLEQLSYGFCKNRMRQSLSNMILR